MSSLDFASYILANRPFATKACIHHLLYLVHGFSLRFRYEGLFEDEFVRGSDGPVAVDVEKNWASLPLVVGGAGILAPYRSFLVSVLTEFEGRDHEYLEKLCHQGPWLHTPLSQLLDDDQVKAHFETLPCPMIEAHLAEKKARLLAHLRDFEREYPSLCSGISNPTDLDQHPDKRQIQRENSGQALSDGQSDGQSANGGQEKLYVPPRYNLYFRCVDPDVKIPEALLALGLPMRERKGVHYFQVSEAIYKEPGPFVGDFDFYGTQMSRHMLPDFCFAR